MGNLSISTSKGLVLKRGSLVAFALPPHSNGIHSTHRWRTAATMNTVIANEAAMGMC